MQRGHGSQPCFGRQWAKPAQYAQLRLRLVGPLCHYFHRVASCVARRATFDNDPRANGARDRSAVMTTMQAAVAREIPTERLEIATVAFPSPEAEDDVVVRVEACGICGTDLHIMAGESYRPVTPFVLGNEPVGTVVAAADAAQEWLGRRIATTNFTGCGRCAWCLDGDERVCPNLVSITGVLGVWGGYAEDIRVHARQALEVAGTRGTLEAASLVDCGATAANSVRVALEKRPGRVLVLGAGPIGFMCAELLRVSEVPVQVVQPSALRR